MNYTKYILLPSGRLYSHSAAGVFSPINHALPPTTVIYHQIIYKHIAATFGNFTCQPLGAASPLSDVNF